MSTDDTLQQAKSAFQKAFDHLKHEFSQLQIGRASSSLVEDVQVEAYGVKQPVKALAGISIPDARTIKIQPWDRSVLGGIEKALQQSDLGLNPVNDGAFLRISLPPLTEERRADLRKVVSRLAEEAKISVRNVRHEVQGSLKDSEKRGEISEDELHIGDKKLQEEVDRMNKEIDQAAAAKEKDIMTV